MVWLDVTAKGVPSRFLDVGVEASDIGPCPFSQRNWADEVGNAHPLAMFEIVCFVRIGRMNDDDGVSASIRKVFFEMTKREMSLDFVTSGELTRFQGTKSQSSKFGDMFECLDGVRKEEHIIYSIRHTQIYKLMRHWVLSTQPGFLNNADQIISPIPSHPISLPMCIPSNRGRKLIFRPKLSYIDGLIYNLGKMPTHDPYCNISQHVKPMAAGHLA